MPSLKSWVKKFCQILSQTLLRTEEECFMSLCFNSRLSGIVVEAAEPLGGELCWKKWGNGGMP